MGGNRYDNGCVSVNQNLGKRKYTMAFDDFYRLSAHAVLLNADGKVLLLKATYGDYGWGLPGGCVDPGETVHEALLRECQEELNTSVDILYMSGIYFHSKHNSHACIFHCTMPNNAPITLSSEHSAYDYFTIDDLPEIQQRRVKECLAFDGKIRSASF